METELSRVIDADSRRMADALHVGGWLAPSALDNPLSAILDSLPTLVTLVTADGALEHANRRTLDYFGATIQQLKRRPMTISVHPDDRHRVLAAWELGIESGVPYEIECRQRRADGEYRWFQMRGFPLRDAHDDIVFWYLLQSDIHEQRRTEALLAGEKRLLEMVARGCGRAEILEELCRFVERMYAASHCSVVLVDPTGTHLEHGAAPDLPPSFIAAINGRPVKAEAGPSAMAAFLNEQVIATDLATETRWADYGWCAMALAHGVRSVWSTPISSSSGKVLGAFAIYYDEPRSPTPLDQELIEQFTHIAQIAIEGAERDEALRRSEARKTAILDSALDCIVTIDHEGHITEFNPAAERTFGFRREDIIGTQLADVIVPPSLRESHLRGLTSYLATGEAHLLGRHVELSAIRADGSEFPVELAITRMPSDGPPSFTGFLRDITDRKSSIADREWAEMQLAGEKQLLEMIASGSPLHDVLTALCNFVERAAPECDCGVYLIDWSGPTFHVGAAPSLPSSYTAPIEGLAVRADVAPCGIAALEQRQVISADLEVDPMWRDTSYCAHVLSHGLRAVWSTPIFSLSGSVLGTFAVYHREAGMPSERLRELIAQGAHIASIAIERAQAEADLERSAAFLSQAQHLSSTGSFSWVVDTEEITWSEELHRMFELDRSTPVTLEAIGTRFHPEDLHLLREMVERAQTAGDDFEYELRLKMPDGSIKYLHLVAHRVRDRKDRIEYLGALQDITERRTTEEALGKLRSELAHMARITSLGALTASIAHEVNQPLSGIITNASTCLRMLAADPPNLEGARETARRTIRDGNRASDVITRLRALFEKKSIASEAVDLNEATREVIALSSVELQRSRVILRPELADDIAPVLGDRVQLQQVILNLLRNAADAMNDVEDRPRQLTIRTEREDGGCVRVSVQDAGVGFDNHAADRLFDAFYTTKSGGMGIGLSVSRSIIENHRGRLWATLNDGPGATFSFSIPRETGGGANARGSDYMHAPITAEKAQMERSS